MSRTFRERLIEFARNRNGKACSSTEIDNVQAKHGVVFPEAYRLFLEVGGHGLDEYYTGSDFELSKLGDLQIYAAELFAENCVTPPPGWFAFLMHQGYQFYFFLGHEVYYYFEGNSGFELRYRSFEEFLESELVSP